MNGNGKDRRTAQPLTDEQLASIKDQLLESIYADIGKSIVKKILWIGGACILALFSWLIAKGHIHLE